MAESVGGINKSTKLQCSICLEGFKSPKLLPCFHSFCKACLVTYAESNSNNTGKFNCPLCRCCIQLPDNGVDGFQSNFYVVTKEIETSEFEASVACDICDSLEAVSRCIECDENMCQICTKSHSKMKLARGHHVAKLGDAGVQVKPKSFCNKHENEEIRFVCKKCDELICINCKLTLHENHTTKDVEDEARQFREELSKLLDSDKCTTLVSKMESNLSKLEESCKKIEEKEKVEIQKILDHGEQLKRNLEVNSEVLCQEVKQKVSERDQIIMKMKEEIQMNIGSYSSLCSSAKHILEMASDVDTIKFGNNLKKRLEDELLEYKNQLPIDIALHIEFIPDQDLVKDDRNLVGTLKSTDTEKEPPAPQQSMQKNESYFVGNSNDVFSIAVKNGNALMVVSRGNQKRKRKSFIIRFDISKRAVIEEFDIKGHFCDNLSISEDDKIFYSSGCAVKYVSVTDMKHHTTVIEFQSSEKISGSCVDLSAAGKPGINEQRFIRGMAFDLNNKEFLLSFCAASTYDRFKSLNYAEKIPGQLVRYKKDGTVKENQFPNWNTHLKYPTKISWNANGDICLLDTGVLNCCLYIIHSEGELKSRFIPKSNTGRGLVPQNVCCDKNCFIFLSYFCSQRIDMLDKDGKPHLNFEVTFLPSALFVDEENRLWIGGKRGKVEIWNYLNKTETN